MIKKNSSGEVSVKITNTANSSNNAPVCTEVITNQTKEIEVGEDQSQIQNLTYEEEIASILAIKPEHRNTFHNRKLTQYQKELQENSTQRTEL